MTINDSAIALVDEAKPSVALGETLAAAIPEPSEPLSAENLLSVIQTLVDERVDMLEDTRARADTASKILATLEEEEQKKGSRLTPEIEELLLLLLLS